MAQPQRKVLFSELAIPQAFTPNGDGINDELMMEFTLVLVGRSTAVEAEVFDLSGRLVARVEERREVSTGHYSIPWDGRDAAGDMLPPGLYAVRLSLDADTGGTGVSRDEVLRTVALTY